MEISSFQLISMRKSADVAVVTNVSPNHLDMHKDMQEYVDAKKNVFFDQSAFGVTVLNADNEITCSFWPAGPRTSAVFQPEATESVRCLGR